tara:strand:- start:7529 stop:8422 length:894 start_codon:yes stop_codon:yes gene_type:complete
MTHSAYIFLLLISLSCTGQTTKGVPYIDADKPGLIAQKFAPDFFSNADEYEFGSVFSKDGTEFFYAVDYNGRAEIRTSTLTKTGWTAPKTILSHPKFGYNDPFLAPDEQQLYYISDRPRNATDTITDIDIWYSQRTTDGWSDPINAGTMINSDKHEYYISFTASGTLYFASNKAAEATRSHDFDIYAARQINGVFERPEKLPPTVNTKRYEADVFVAPDESYLVFSTARQDGFGNGDLYISFKDANQQWQEAKNLGTAVNTEGHELCPFVTADGKYLLFTSNQDIYWVSTQLFEQFK